MVIMTQTQVLRFDHYGQGREPNLKQHTCNTTAANTTAATATMTTAATATAACAMHNEQSHAQEHRTIKTAWGKNGPHKTPSTISV
jgi:hypothetical protein